MWIMCATSVRLYIFSCIHKDVCKCICVCVCVDFQHPGPSQFPHFSSTSCCFGPNPSCWPASPHQRSDTVFPSVQMKKVKKRTWLPEPEGSATNQGQVPFFPPVRHNKGATSAQEIITTSTTTFPQKHNRNSE